MLSGIDISALQPPEKLAYPQLDDFVIVRTSYGSRPDKHFQRHVRGVRNQQRRRRAERPLVLGAYHFYRWKAKQPWEAQLETWLAQLEAVDFARTTGCYDMVPALDVEANEAHDDPIELDRYLFGALRMLETIAVVYGTAMVYIGPAWYSRLGLPPGFRRFVLWGSDYRATPFESPGFPDWPWVLHQWTGTGRHRAIAGGTENACLNHARRLPIIRAATYAPVTDLLTEPVGLRGHLQ